MLLPVHGIINPVSNYRFYQVLSDQCEPSMVQNDILVTYLGILTVDSERTANCSVGHRARTGRLIVAVVNGGDA